MREPEKSKAQLEVEDLIDAFNNTHESKISYDPVMIFHIAAILTRLELLRKDPVRASEEYAKYQNDLYKVSKLLRSSSVNELKFITPTGKPVKVTSKLLIDLIIEGLNLKEAKENVGGRRKDPVVDSSYYHIMALLSFNVPIEFISDLLGIENPETLQRALSRSRTKPSSKSQ